MGSPDPSKHHALEVMRNLTPQDRGWVIGCLEADKREEEWDRHREVMEAQERWEEERKQALVCCVLVCDIKATIIDQGKGYCTKHIPAQYRPN